MKPACQKSMFRVQGSGPGIPSQLRRSQVSGFTPHPFGFTLIELLASITILMIIVSILGTIFTESDRAWRLGTSRADSNNEGRAAITAIAQDLQYAIAFTNAGTGARVTFMMRPDTSRTRPGLHPSAQWPVYSYGVTNSEICFVALQGSAEDIKGTPAGTNYNRGSRCVYYWVREATDNDNLDGKPLGTYELMRKEVTSLGTPSVRLTKPYVNSKWYEDSGTSGADNRNDAPGRGVIAANVAGLSFYASSNSVIVPSYDSGANAGRLPEFVDVLLEVLTDEDAQRAAQLNLRDAAGVAEFVDKNARRYTTRVYFQNRQGYRARP